MIRVLFVCLGNICRSPSAQGVFESLIEAEGLSGVIGADSAGTAAYHIGEPPDARATAAAALRGIDLGPYRARQVMREDFHDFDLVLAMDRANHAAMARIVPEGREGRLRLFLDFAPEIAIDEVPDPYYGGEDGFERVLDMVEAASRGVLAHIRAEHRDQL
jgi:protein-tyrosine phosphatase